MNMACSIYRSPVPANACKLVGIGGSMRTKSGAATVVCKRIKNISSTTTQWVKQGTSYPDRGTIKLFAVSYDLQTACEAIDKEHPNVPGNGPMDDARSATMPVPLNIQCLTAGTIVQFDYISTSIPILHLFQDDPGNVATDLGRGRVNHRPIEWLKGHV